MYGLACVVALGKSGYIQGNVDSCLFLPNDSERSRDGISSGYFGCLVKLVLLGTSWSPRQMGLGND